MELLALVISLVALAISLFVLYQSRRIPIVDVNLVYEILPKEEEPQAEAEDGPRVLVQTPAEDFSAWKNRTGLPFTDFGPPPPPIARQIAPPLSRPDGFV